MLSKYLRLSKTTAHDLLSSKLFNELTFYAAFLKYLANCHSEVIIESPFVTNRRMCQLASAFQKLKARKVRVAVDTRDPRDQDDDWQRDESYKAIATLQRMGVHVLELTVYVCNVSLHTYGS